MKEQLSVLSKELIIKEMIRFEGNLRCQVFFKMREDEIRGRKVKFVGTNIKTVFPCPADYETYELDESVPGCKMARANIYAIYQVGSKYHEVLVNNRSGWGLPFKLPMTIGEFDSIMGECNLVANEIAQLIFGNWKVMNPCLEEYLKDGTQEWRLFVWTNQDDIRWIVASSYAEIKDLVGTEDGKIRRLDISLEAVLGNKKTLTPRDLSQNEVARFLANENGAVSKPEDLMHSFEREVEQKEFRQRIKQTYSVA